ncbi:hypothetical protein SISNIDRAFT_134223 [Sistotremastrum niveocremeum HHB9708]|uniref:Uncharacterized protein n=1 Tax=Sistotremastrum niveocremeum HHB9708 TaxID=1314777 RepID=A0A164ZWS2_9AGAM|nr:hypothetical protein SISNIDRAFT_134223 [Sistotremastrum niveocremeum HHB9708]
MASPPFKKLPQRMPLAPLPVPPPRLVVDDIHQATSPVDPERRRRRTQRRESLDSRRSSLPHASPIPQQQQHQNIPQPFSNSLYDNLATYTFGDVRSSPRSTHSHSESPRHHNQDDEWDDLAYDEDDDHDRARNDRAKMRAIDDGSRRPSLPSNLPSPTSRRPSLPIAVPQSPVDSSPYAGFDLSYILAPPLPASFPPRRPSTASALSNSDGNTDTFARHVRKNDSEYERRKGAWSFKRTAGVSSRPGPSGEKGGYQVWGCDCVGRFAISRYKHKGAFLYALNNSSKFNS